MKTEFWAAILLSAAALAALAGCAADGTAGERAESGKTEITLGAWYYSSAESWAPLVEKFNEENDIDFTKTSFAITADSGCKDGAWAFIEFALRDESQLALAGGIAGGWGFELAQSDIEKLSLLVDGTEEYLWCF